MEPSILQVVFALTSFALIMSVHSGIPLSIRHGFNSVLPLQAPPLGSYRYQFRSVHHSSSGGFSGDDNSTENPLNDIITNLHKLESMFFGNNSFFHNYNFKNKKNRTRLNFPKWFNSWPDFDDDDDGSSTEGNEEMGDPCGGGGGFDFSDFDGIIMEIKKEIDDFFSDMGSIFPNFHKDGNSTESSSSEEDWVDDFLNDIKKSFDKKYGDDGKKEEADNDKKAEEDNGDAEELGKLKIEHEKKEDMAEMKKHDMDEMKRDEVAKPEEKTEQVEKPEEQAT